MQVGDVYRDKITAEQLASSRRAYGNGPFQITRITREQGLRVVYVKSLENDRHYGPWADPKIGASWMFFSPLRIRQINASRRHISI